MPESLFGSVPQIWSPIPGAAFGYLHALPQGGQGLGALPSAVASPPVAFGGFMSGPPLAPAQPLSEMGQRISAAWPPVTPASFSAGNLPVAPGVELVNGVTAQVVVATVAMRRGQPSGPTTDQ